MIITYVKLKHTPASTKQDLRQTQERHLRVAKGSVPNVERILDEGFVDRLLPFHRLERILLEELGEGSITQVLPWHGLTILPQLHEFVDPVHRCITDRLE